MNRFIQSCRLALTGACCLFAATNAHSQVTIDVLGIYSNHTAQLVSDPQALFVSNIEYANRALANSGANYRYNLVHVQQSNWSNDASLGGSQLESFAQNGAIQDLREQYGADFVAGIVPQSGGLCGIGYLPISGDGQTIRSYSRRYAYSLSGHNCGGRTMAHEMGHNAGLGHSAAQDSSGTFGDWARGHGVNGSFVTIMAYNSAYNVRSSAGRVQIHSNPSLNTCRGQRCGIDFTQSNGADAVRALNRASTQLSEYAESTGGGGGGGPVNAAPQATNDSATTDEDQAVSLNVLANDSDPDNDVLTLVSITRPSNGSATVQSSSGTVRYVPSAGFFGNDRFNYTVRDAAGATATARVNITVSEVDDGGPPAGSNLVPNGDAESGLEGWSGIWGARVSLARPGLQGSASVRTSGGYAVTADLATPIAGGRRFSFSAKLRATEINRAYAYLRVREGGVWRYQYLTGAYLRAGQEREMSHRFTLPSGEVSDGYVLFYFPQRMRGNILLDAVQVQVE